MSDIRTNVIYVTTKCPLDCGYCYEREQRQTEGFKHKTVTPEEIDAFVEEVSTREHGVQSCVVIFGGEPLLRPDLVWELMDKFVARKTGGICFDLITNGILITPEIAQKLRTYSDKLQRHNAAIQIEVSYDVSGQGRRTYADGRSSDEQVLAGIAELQKSGVPFAISYVISSTNVNNILRDTLYCIIKLKAMKVSLKWAGAELDTAGIPHKEIRKNLRSKLQEVYRRYQVPICEEVCGDCRRCNKSKDGNNYFIPDSGFVKQATYVDGGFNHFIDGPDNPNALKYDLSHDGMAIELKRMEEDHYYHFTLRGVPPFDVFTLDASSTQQFLTKEGIKSVVPSEGIAQLNVGDSVQRADGSMVEVLKYTLVEGSLPSFSFEGINVAPALFASGMLPIHKPTRDA